MSYRSYQLRTTFRYRNPRKFISVRSTKIFIIVYTRLTEFSIFPGKTPARLAFSREANRPRTTRAEKKKKNYSRCRHCYFRGESGGVSPVVPAHDDNGGDNSRSGRRGAGEKGGEAGLTVGGGSGNGVRVVTTTPLRIQQRERYTAQGGWWFDESRFDAPRCTRPDTAVS